MCGFIAKKLLPSASTADRDRLRRLERFSRLADAGVDAMSTIWKVVGAAQLAPQVSLSDIARQPPVALALERLRRTSRVWRTREPARIPDLDTADRLAQAMATARGTRGQLEALLQHHLLYGGGRRWFALRGEQVTATTAMTGVEAARYRFRLWPLARLARQCGLLAHIPRALVAEAGDVAEEE
jgi:hypothetical protein